MRRNATSCFTWRLYVILDQDVLGPRDALEIAASALRGGADALQWRAKHASAAECLAVAQRLRRLTRQARVPLIINDRPDIACAADADGVHLGQEDLPLDAARRLMGHRRLIGQSTHSLKQALAAARAGADYIGFGPLYPTPTKPAYQAVGLKLIPTLTRRSRLPVICIGGIDAKTLPHVIRAGARCVAVVRAVCQAPDPEQATRSLKSRLLMST